MSASQQDHYREVFKEEAYELLAELETSLLELEEKPEDQDLIGRVFRAMHTIKGSGNMFGFTNIAEFTHNIETIYDLIRDGKMSVTKEIINLSLSARDHILLMLDSSDKEITISPEAGKIINSFKELIPDKPVEEEFKDDMLPDSSDISEEKEFIYRIRFKPNSNIFLTGTNPLGLLDELRELGTAKVIAYTDKLPELKIYNPDYCYTYWDIILISKRDLLEIKDVFLFVEDDCELRIDVIDDVIETKRLGQILTEKGDITEEDIQRALSSQKRIGEILVESGLVTEKQIQSALMEQQAIKEVQEKKRGEESGTTSIRVSSDKLDKLVDLVGELVIAQARLSAIVSKVPNAELTSVSEEIEYLTTELRDNTLSVRMVAIGTTFSKFRRLVRDLSSELGKEVEMTTDGAETELDKTVIERLNDPMVHLIRNCIDHGIEKPEKRELEGKPRSGNIHLSAYHSGANVFIEIRDDGAGLNTDAIKKKAIDRGIISGDTEMSEKEIFFLILQPGFSTAEKITNVSGRGVGMDVVKRCIDSLRGTIEITSKKGVGTTIYLKLPLTLAIIEGLLVKVAQDYFVMPLSSVEECVELSRKDIANAHGRHIINVRDEIVPYIRLSEHFNVHKEEIDIEQVVVTGFNGHRIGFVVDEVIGEHQTVLKNLGKIYQNINGISGATILGDGTVALILDIMQLIKKSEEEEIVL